MNPYKLCERCTARNCRREPKKKKYSYVCYKRKPIKGGFPLLEMALTGSYPLDILELVYQYGFQVKDMGKGKSYKLMLLIQ